MPIKPEMMKELIQKVNQKPPAEKVKLVGLTKLLGDIYTADDRFATESSKINYENHTKLKMLYNSTLEIMNNNKAISLEHCQNLPEYFTPEEMDSEEFKNATPPFNAEAQNLWLYLFDKTPFLKSMITDKDREVLKALINVEVFLSEDSNDYKIEFTFKENEYIANSKLVVEVFVGEEEEEIEEVKSTEVQWKPGKDVRNVEIEKKQKNKKTGQMRVTKKQEKTDSFFWLFKNHVIPDEEEDEDDEERELDQDPLGDAELYYNACDIVQFLKNSFFTFFIPAAYDVPIKEFDDPAIMDFDENAEKQANDKGDQKGYQKPECKQQ